MTGDLEGLALNMPFKDETLYRWCIHRYTSLVNKVTSLS